MEYPTSIKRADEIEFLHECRSIAHYKGITYVGLSDGSIVKVDQDYATHTFIERYKDGFWLQGLAVHNDLLYALRKEAKSETFSVFEYDLQGRKSRELDRPPYSTTVVNVTVVGNKLVIPHADEKNIALVACSLEDREFQQVWSAPHNKSTADPIEFASICAVGEDSVVVSDSLTSTIFRVNISTGQRMWKLNCDEPSPVVCYQETYLLQVAVGSGKIRVRILDLDSGNLISDPLHGLSLPSKQVYTNPELSGVAGEAREQDYNRSGPTTVSFKPEMVDASGMSRVFVGNTKGRILERNHGLCSIALAVNRLVVATPDMNFIRFYKLE